MCAILFIINVQCVEVSFKGENCAHYFGRVFIRNGSPLEQFTSFEECSGCVARLIATTLALKKQVKAVNLTETVTEVCVLVKTARNKQKSIFN